MKPEYGALIFALLANAVANILIKEGMNGKPLSLSEPLETFKAIAFNPVLIVGVTFFGLALAAYSFVLSHIKLSVAYPIMTTLGFVIVGLYSVLKLGESVSLVQGLGMLLILGGVWMVASAM